jgi:hypothetical protein
LEWIGFDEPGPFRLQLGVTDTRQACRVERSPVFCRLLSRRAGVITALLRRVTARGGGHVKRSLELTKAVHSYAQLAAVNTAPAVGVAEVGTPSWRTILRCR